MSESEFDGLFHELSRQAEGLEDMLRIMTPPQKAADVEFQTAAEGLERYSAADVLRFPELRAMLAEVHQRVTLAALSDQAERFGRLIDTEPAALGALNTVRRMAIPLYASSYERDKMAHLPYHQISIGYPNPGELLDLLEPEEDLLLGYSPEDRENMRKNLESKEVTGATMSGLAFLEDDLRAAAYEGMFRELYGDRWGAYKETTGFGSFEAWQVRIQEAQDNPDETEAIAQAQIKLED